MKCIYILLLGHPIKHGRLKVCVTSREMVKGEKDEKSIHDDDGKEVNDERGNLNRTVCQIVKVRVFDNLHACSSCQSEDCSTIEMSKFKQVSISIHYYIITLFHQAFSSSSLNYQYWWNTDPGVIGHLQLPTLGGECPSSFHVVCKIEGGG